MNIEIEEKPKTHDQMQNNKTDHNKGKSDKDVDEAAQESFPASDPPAWINRGKTS